MIFGSELVGRVVHPPVPFLDAGIEDVDTGCAHEVDLAAVIWRRWMATPPVIVPGPVWVLIGISPDPPCGVCLLGATGAARPGRAAPSRTVTRCAPAGRRPSPSVPGEAHGARRV